jgi:hypothetical protein
VDNFAAAFKNVAPSTVVSNFPPSKAGPACFSVRFGQVLTAGVLRVEIRDAKSDATMATAAANIGSQVDTLTLLLDIPNRPLRLLVVSSAAQAPAVISIYASLVFTD